MDTALPSISPSGLVARLGRAGPPLLFDVRRRERFAASGHLLASARHCAPEDVAALAASQPPGEAVVSCVHGHKVSEDAVPYDIAQAPIPHVGERCSFDALLSAFELQDPVLHALAEIVRGADTDRLALAPPSAGLLAISLGLSRPHADEPAVAP